MHNSYTLSEYVYNQEKTNREIREAIQLTAKQVAYLQKAALSEIRYPTYKEAYDYVDHLFPMSKVKSVSVFKVSLNLMEKFGFGAAEGFYHRSSKTIIMVGTVRPRMINDGSSVFDIQAKITRDEVVVHELLHYVFEDEGRYSISREMNEEFAYGYSIGYLKQKGYTDEEIVKNNFLPYLFTVEHDHVVSKLVDGLDSVARDKLRNSIVARRSFFKENEKKINEMSKSLAIEHGHKLIKLYSKLLDEKVIAVGEKENISRFDLLDFS